MTQPWLEATPLVYETGPAANQHEAAARAKKVAKLIVAVARVSDGELPSAVALRSLPQKWWNDLARSVGVRDPSSKTVAAVIARFEETPMAIGPACAIVTRTGCPT